MYVCIYVCMCVYCMYVYVYIICIYACRHGCADALMYGCMYVCMYVCIHACTQILSIGSGTACSAQPARSWQNRTTHMCTKEMSPLPDSLQTCGGSEPKRSKSCSWFLLSPFQLTSLGPNIILSKYVKLTFRLYSIMRRTYSYAWCLLPVST